MLKCLKDERINLQHFTSGIDEWFLNIDLSQDDITLVQTLRHMHEPIDLLEQKFGNKYDIISVYRNRHETFISLYNHIIQMINRVDETSANIMKHLSVDDVLFFNSNDISGRDYEKELMVDGFVKQHNLKNNYQIKTWLIALFTPAGNYHLHDSRIKWFDFNKLYELEEWVSNKLEFEFKLDKLNTSKHIESNLKLNDKFIKKYNSIYDRFDLPKKNKSLI
jgi:hypothetical protein